MPRPLHRIDAALGDGLEAVVRAHYRRRLRRLGQLAALEPGEGGGPWARTDPPPRDGVALDVLIDGAEALPEIAAAIAGARRSVLIAGWHAQPDFKLGRGEDAPALKPLLAEAAERAEVRLLVWAGAPVPVYDPRRGNVRRIVDEFRRDTRIRVAADSHERLVHCHHEKLVVVDGEVAFVGGIDLTRLAGDRFDSNEHAVQARMGWHDAALRVRGPLVADVAAHVAMRWQATTGERLALDPPPPPAGELRAQFVRTVADGMYDALPRGAFGILEAYVRALRGARRFVYLENQFLWSPEIVALLEDKLRHPPSEDFRLVVLLPAKPNDGSDDTRGQLARLMQADDDHGRLLPCTVYARSEGKHGPLYVHAKIGIVDDAWLTIGSANLNERSLFNDSEANVVCDDPALARRTRERLWAEHLELDEAALRGRDPVELIDALWEPISTEQRRRQDAGEPMTHRLIRLPGVSSRSKRLLGPLQSLLVDG